MLVDQVSRGDVLSAFEWMNEAFDGNVFIDITDKALDEDSRGLWKVSMHVQDLKGPGHMLNRPPAEFSRPWPIRSVCFHVRHLFYLFLPDQALFKDYAWLSRAENSYAPYIVRRHGVTASITDLCECVHNRLELYVPYMERYRIANKVLAKAPTDLPV